MQHKKTPVHTCKLLILRAELASFIPPRKRIAVRLRNQQPLFKGFYLSWKYSRKEKEDAKKTTQAIATFDRNSKDNEMFP